MSEDPGEKRGMPREARVVSLVIVATAVLYVAAQIADGQLGLSTRIMFLFDLMALAGFLWAFIVTWQIWRKRRG